MWDWTKKQSGLCARYSAALEELPVEIGEAAGCAELRKSLPAQLAAHAADCSSCKAAQEMFWASRKLLAGQFFEARQEMPAGLNGAPWFATRVMTKIAEREAEVHRARMEWSGAVSKLASRLAWASALMLLVTSTWLYDPQPAGPQSNGSQSNSAGQSSTEAAPQYLFDSASAPSNVDDALVSPAGR